MGGLHGLTTQKYVGFDATERERGEKDAMSTWTRSARPGRVSVLLLLPDRHALRASQPAKGK